MRKSIQRRILQWGLLGVCAVAAICVLVSAYASERHVGLTPGQPAPSFSLESLRGESVKLSQFEGKGILLNFWASWCNPCVNELPLLNEAYKLAGVQMVAVNMGESADTVQKFVDRYELAFPVVLDQKLDLKSKYQITGMPLTVLLNDEGVVIERHEGELKDMADILRLMERIKS